MKCPTCGTEIQPGQKYCPSCGTVQKMDQSWRNSAGTTVIVRDRDIPKTEFYRNYAADSTRRNIRSAAIVCYFCTLVTIVLAILFAPLMLIDAAVILVLGLLIQLKQNRVCAILLLAYGVTGFSLTMLDGRMSGWLIVLAGVFAVIDTFRLEKEYRDFRDQ